MGLGGRGDGEVGHSTIGSGSEQSLLIVVYEQMNEYLKLSNDKGIVSKRHQRRR